MRRCLLTLAALVSLSLLGSAAEYEEVLDLSALSLEQLMAIEVEVDEPVVPRASPAVPVIRAPGRPRLGSAPDHSTDAAGTPGFPGQLVGRDRRSR